MSRKKYNKNIYKSFAKTTKFIRGHFSSEPLETIKNTGMTGAAFADIAEKPIDNMVHNVSKSLTRLSYNEKKDNPCKGSAIYTCWWLLIKKGLKLLITLLFTMVPFVVIRNFFEADPISKISMILGLMPVMLIVLGICKAYAKIKSFFKC